MVDYLSQGSLLVIFAALLGAGMGLPISEDLVIVTTGALSERGIVDTVPALVTCLAGVLAGDFMLYLFGRHLGRRAYDHRWFRRILSVERRARTEALYVRLGGGAVFVSRFLIGFRIPGFAMAGIMKMPAWKFLAWDALGLAITGPTVFFAGYFFSDRLDEIEQGLRTAEGWVLAGVVVMIVVGAAAWRVRRRILGRRADALGDADAELEQQPDSSGTEGE